MLGENYRGATEKIAANQVRDGKRVVSQTQKYCEGCNSLWTHTGGAIFGTSVEMKNCPSCEMKITKEDVQKVLDEPLSSPVFDQPLINRPGPLQTKEEQQKAWGKDQIFHRCVKGIAPYPRILCSVCPSTVPLDGTKDFNAYEELKRLNNRGTVINELKILQELLEKF